MRNPLEGDYTFDPPVVLLAALEKNLIKDTREVLGTVFNQAPTTCEWGPRFEESFSKINPTGEFTKNGEVWRWVLPNPISPEQREPGKISITPKDALYPKVFYFFHCFPPLDSALFLGSLPDSPLPFPRCSFLEIVYPSSVEIEGTRLLLTTQFLLEKGTDLFCIRQIISERGITPGASYLELILSDFPDISLEYRLGRVGEEKMGEPKKVDLTSRDKSQMILNAQDGRYLLDGGGGLRLGLSRQKVKEMITGR